MIVRIIMTIYFVVILVNGFPLLRLKRQATPPPRDPLSPELIEILNNFQPQGSSRCPENFYLCRDGSYCFDDEQLCGGADVCPDSSDDINAICPRNITPHQNKAAVSSSQTSSTAHLTQTPGSTSAKSEWPSYEGYGRPLVIAFLVLVGGLFIYVALATYCCITNRWNVINPNR